MKVWLKRVSLVLGTCGILLLSLSIADCFLFEQRVRGLFRQVADVPIGSSRDRILWMKDEYPPVFSDADFSANIELQVYLTKLNYIHFPFHIVPRKLLMRDAVVGGLLEVTNHGKNIELSSDFDKEGSPRHGLTIVEGNLRLSHSGQVVATLPGMTVWRTRRGYDTIIEPEAGTELRHSAYEIDFHCLWRWNTCNPAPYILTH